MKKPFAAVVSVCLLMLQLSGAHAHANDSGYLGMPEVSYDHTHEHHHNGDAHHRDDGSRESDHDHVRDISLLDPALLTFKMPLALFAAPIVFAQVPVFTVLAGAEIIYPVLSGRHTRWRPPLRAPPLQA